MEKIKKNLSIIIYLLIMCILTGIMFYNIDKKEGFHEDEIFSYGASNSTLGNTFLTYARSDNIDIIMKDNNPFIAVKNFIYYKVIHPEEYSKMEEKIGNTKYSPIWRTSEDAIEYIQIDNLKEALNFFAVYWNTAKDVHPPLFYFAVHIVSILFYGHFSKYIIFYINLAFFLGTCIVLRKIFLMINKKHLAIPNLILYGASIGAISTVMFQRMYMMLTFFTVWFLYTNLKIYYNNFELTKKLKIELCSVIVLGFLTQYYFCFYAVFLAFCMLIILIKRKEKNKTLHYFLQYVRAGIIGVILFLPSINHIFFSYRGLGGREDNFTYLNGLKEFSKQIYIAFGLSLKVGIIISIILLILLIVVFKKSKNKVLYTLFIVPVLLDFFIVVKMSPYRSLRYMMNILPIISIVVIILMDELFKNIKLSTIILSMLAIIISIYGLITTPVKYLYIGYNNYLEIAEKYKEDRFVLVSSTAFCHIQDVPEFKIYKASMAVGPEWLESLKDVEEFESEDEFILSIKRYLDESPEEILEKVLEYTGFSNYELLYESSSSARANVYRIYK